jgi:hypothetical protein
LQTPFAPLIPPEIFLEPKVPRKTKNQPGAAPSGEGEISPPAANPQAAAAAPARSAKAKKTAAKKIAAKKKSSAAAPARKTITKRKSAAPKSAGAGVKPTSAAEVAPQARPEPIAPPSPQPQTEPKEPSDSEIRIRAYFIAERRAQMSIHRDPALDWIEAREQLMSEAQ